MNLAQGYLDAFLRQFRSSLFSPPPLSLSPSIGNWRISSAFSSKILFIDTMRFSSFLLLLLLLTPTNSTTRGVERINLSPAARRRGLGRGKGGI